VWRLCSRTWLRQAKVLCCTSMMPFSILCWIYNFLHEECRDLKTHHIMPNFQSGNQFVGCTLALLEPYLRELLMELQFCHLLTILSIWTFVSCPVSIFGFHDSVVKKCLDYTVTQIERDYIKSTKCTSRVSCSCNSANVRLCSFPCSCIRHLQSHCTDSLILVDFKK
jgi:hypothetical protein